MRSQKLFYHSLVFMLLINMSVRPLQAGYMYPIEIFTSNGNYYDSPDLNICVEVFNPVPQQVDFTFYNNSSINSCVAEIYFDSGSIFSFAGITNGPGTFFEQPTTPKNLPAGQTRTPSFQTSAGLSFGAFSPAPENGINSNPGEWLKISLNINGDTWFEEIADRLKAGDIRIGAHIIALPDGSSESGISIPEPLTFCFLAAGALAFLRRRKA